MDHTTDLITAVHEDRVLRVTITNPSRRNAIDYAAMAKLPQGPHRALELTKRALNATGLAALPAALAREKAGQRELLVGPDFAEGSAAMLEKRKAVFA